MPLIETTVSCPVRRSFRVAQIVGMFDVPIETKAAQTFALEIPALDEDWKLGLIVGPSGSGKTTLARAAFGDAYDSPAPWPTDAAVIDGFGELPIKTITHALTAVGLGSPPAWLRPYHTLSNGERFRCDLARALVNAKGQGDEGAKGQRDEQKGEAKKSMPKMPSPSPLGPFVSSPLPLVVFDEFTSVVDRTVAQTASAAIAKAIRSGRFAARLVAVTCHDDVAAWLAPDWIVDVGAGTLSRRLLRRPELRLQVARCRRTVWRLFARHHYLARGLSRGAACYVALWNERPIAFCAIAAQLGRRGWKRSSRIVTLPDFQGLGIGARLAETVARHEQSRGFQVSITASHPAIVAGFARSAKRKCVGTRSAGQASRQRIDGREIPTALGRSVVTFDFAEEV